MKLATTLFLLFFTFVAIGQNIPKGTNTIVIQSKDTTRAEAFNNICELLLDSNIEIGQTNKDLYYLTTAPTECKSIVAKLTLRVQEKNGKINIIVSGKFAMGMDMDLGAVTIKDSFSNITFSGMKGSPVRQAWDYMNGIAAKVPNKSVSYETK